MKMAFSINFEKAIFFDEGVFKVMWSKIVGDFYQEIS